MQCPGQPLVPLICGAGSGSGPRGTSSVRRRTFRVGLAPCGGARSIGFARRQADGCAAASVDGAPDRDECLLGRRDGRQAASVRCDRAGDRASARRPARWRCPAASRCATGRSRWGDALRAATRARGNACQLGRAQHEAAGQHQRRRQQCRDADAPVPAAPGRVRRQHAHASPDSQAHRDQHQGVRVQDRLSRDPGCASILGPLSSVLSLAQTNQGKLCASITAA